MSGQRRVCDLSLLATKWRETRKSVRYGAGDKKRIHLALRRFDGLQTGRENQTDC